MNNDIEQPVTGDEANPQPATGEPAKANPTTEKPVGETSANQPEETLEQARARAASAEKRISELNKENEKHRKAADAAEKATLTEQGKFKELYEAEIAKREEAEKRAAGIERERLLDRVAAKHKLPEKLRDRLRGDDEAALEIDAAELAKLMIPAKPEAPDLNSQNGGASQSVVSEAEVAEVAQKMGLKLPPKSA